MSTSVTVNTYTHSVTYVTDNVLRTLKNIISLSGLSPAKMVNQWASLHLAMNTWMQSQHLKTVVLEVYKPSDNSLVGRWDIDISYGWSGDDGRFWVDTDQIATAIRKAGILAASCEYSILFITSPGRPDVYGWGDGSLRSTSGFVKQSLGGTVEHSGLGGNASYYRKAT